MYTPLALEHQQNSLKGGICHLPYAGLGVKGSDTGSSAQALSTAPSALSYLTAASGAVCADSTTGAGVAKGWLRLRTLTRCLRPKCVWTSLQANQVHAVHTLEKLGEPPQLKALGETLQWYLEPIGEFSSQLVSTQLWTQPCGTMKCATFKTRKLQDVIYGNVCRIPWLC